MQNQSGDEMNATTTTTGSEPPEPEQFDEPANEEPEEAPKFSESQMNELISTYKLFIKKKQPNSVCFATVACDFNFELFLDCC